MIARHKNLVLVGTSHIAKHSITEIKQVIESENPCLIAVELDHRRLHALLSKERPKPSLALVRKVGMKGFLFAALGSWVQRKLGKLYKRGRGVEKDEELAAYWFAEPQLAETEPAEVAAAEPPTDLDGAERPGDEEDDVPFERQPADNPDETPSVADDPPADEEEVDRIPNEP